MVKILQKETLNVKCPHCSREITDAWMCKVESVIGTRYVYLCIDCQKLIGIASQKINAENPNFLRKRKTILPPGSEIS